MTTRRLVWVFAICSTALLVAAATAADERAVWKYDKGSFEKQPDGKWVQKEGDKTYTLEERVNKDDVIQLYDKGRKLNVELREKSAKIVAGPGKVTTVEGKWVAAADAKGPDPKPKDDKRTVWKYEKGTFEKLGDGKWVHKEGDTTREYKEKTVKDDYIEIEHEAKGRKEIVRLAADHASLRVVGGKAKDGQMWKGGWADDAQAKKDPDPKKGDAKAESKTKSAEGHFAEVAAFRRTEQVGSLALAPSPDGKKVALLHGRPFEGRYGIYDIEAKKYDASWKLPNYVSHVVWSGDGKSLAAEAPSTEIKAGKLSKVFVWDTGTWEQRAEFEIEAVPFSLALSADGNTVAVSGPVLERGHLLKVWDVGAKKEILSQKIDSTSANLALTADGKVLAVSGSGPMKDQIAFLDLPGGKVRGSIKCRPDFVMSGDGNTVAEWVNGADNLTVNVWNTKAAAKGPRVIKLEKWKADKLIFLKDQYLAISGGLTQDEVKVFDLKTLAEFDSIKLSRPPKGIARKYMLIEASPDASRLLIYATGDTLVRIWSTPFGPKDEAPIPKEKDKKE